MNHAAKIALVGSLLNPPKFCPACGQEIPGENGEPLITEEEALKILSLDEEKKED